MTNSQSACSSDSVRLGVIHLPSATSYYVRSTSALPTTTLSTGQGPVGVAVTAVKDCGALELCKAPNSTEALCERRERPGLGIGHRNSEDQ